MIWAGFAPVDSSNRNSIFSFVASDSQPQIRHRGSKVLFSMRGWLNPGLRSVHGLMWAPLTPASLVGPQPLCLGRAGRPPAPAQGGERPRPRWRPFPREGSSGPDPTWPSAFHGEFPTSDPPLSRVSSLRRTRTVFFFFFLHK